MKPRAALTLAEAAQVLDPPITAEALSRVVRELPKLRPVGRRPPGAKGGRPAATYDFDELAELHAALGRWL